MTLRNMLVWAAVLAFGASSGSAGDWPMWRFDAGRSGATPHRLADELALSWSRELPAPRPAWPPSQPRLRFDASYEPIVVGQRLIVGSMVDDSLTAYSTETGDELWRFYTDGPVRFAPASDGERVFAVSDDGFLYALDPPSGRLLWKVNGGPHERPILGNDRLVSTWTARGGAVVADGVVYFTASIWPSMGIFIHAVDARTGEVLWTNSETGSLFTVHPHGASSFGSIAPQGYLTVAGDYLVVPGGRTSPAVFDRHSGKLTHFEFRGKGGGGWGVMAAGELFVANNELLRLADGAGVGSVAADVSAGGFLVGSAGSGRITGTSLKGEVRKEEAVDRRGNTITRQAFVPQRTWEFSAAGPTRVRLQAGDRLFAVDRNRVVAYDVAARNTDARREPVRREPARREPVWSATVEGTVWSLLAGDEKLFVVTEEGGLHCFAAPHDTPPRTHARPAEAPALKEDARTAAGLLQRTGVRDGYAIVAGLGSERLIDELLADTELHLIVVDPDAGRIDRFRRRMSDAGLYGVRVAARAGDPRTFPYPPYLSHLTIVNGPATIDRPLIENLFRALRPYGGTLAVPLSADDASQVAETAAAELPGAEVQRADGWTMLARVGPLPGSAPWTHQYADAANSVVSKESLVKAPLGVLWFGGPANDKVLPRHGHGPSPQVAGGRLFIEGPDMIRAVDVYTGRLLWEKDLPGIGKFYDNTGHQPGANEIGSNYVSLPDRLYVVFGEELLELEAATGETLRTFTQQDDSGQPVTWGFPVVLDGLLIATSTPVKVELPGRDEADKPLPPASGLDEVLQRTRYAAASRRLVVFDRHSGQVLWERTAEFSFRHNGIAAAAGRLFVIDGMSPLKLQTLRRRGIDASGQTRLIALDARTGRELWSTRDDVFGTFLNYSAEHDVLLQAGSASSDRARDEVGKGMVAYRGRDGEVLWKDLDISYNGPCMLWRDKIITNGRGGFQLQLLTGERTGWSYRRMYGCNTAVGSEHLLTFRSGAAGFCDLNLDSGTGNLGGFRSGCTSNLIPADGVLNAPDYTRTCTCSYQNQTSLALVHMPEAEVWTFNASVPQEEFRQRIGINLGAPGDRRDDAGTLWLDFPAVGGPSPGIDLKVQPAETGWFRRHASLVESDGPDWVAASGGEGLRSLRLKLADQRPRRYTVRLHFCEPAAVAPGERVFSVALQDETVLPALDVLREANGPQRGIVREFRGVTIGGELRIDLAPLPTARNQMPLLSGVEVVAEDP